MPVLVDDAADRGGVEAALHAVEHHLRDRRLALLGLAARLEIHRFGEAALLPIEIVRIDEPGVVRPLGGVAGDDRRSSPGAVEAVAHAAGRKRDRRRRDLDRDRVRRRRRRRRQGHRARDGRRRPTGRRRDRAAARSGGAAGGRCRRLDRGCLARRRRIGSLPGREAGLGREVERVRAAGDERACEVVLVRAEQHPARAGVPAAAQIRAAAAEGRAEVDDRIAFSGAVDGRIAGDAGLEVGARRQARRNLFGLVRQIESQARLAHQPVEIEPRQGDTDAEPHAGGRDEAADQQRRGRARERGADPGLEVLAGRGRERHEPSGRERPRRHGRADPSHIRTAATWTHESPASLPSSDMRAPGHRAPSRAPPERLSRGNVEGWLSRSRRSHGPSGLRLSPRSGAAPTVKGSNCARPGPP